MQDLSDPKELVQYICIITIFVLQNSEVYWLQMLSYISIFIYGKNVSLEYVAR